MTTLTVTETRPTRWVLAGTMTRAYASRPLFVGIHPWLLRPLFWLQLLLGEWRANPSGSAVCSVSTGSVTARVKASLATVVLLAVAVLLIAFERVTWPLLVALALAACLCLPMVRRSAAGIGPRRQLHRAHPGGRTVTVHSVASVEAGAGRALLEELNEEADRRGWTMTLDAANEALAAYYEQLGYVRLADPVLMPSGERNVAMARAPRPVEELSR